MDEYITLLESFIEQEISSSEFEHNFLKMFKNNKSLMQETEFQILDKLFGDIDSYCENPQLFDSYSDINEDELRLRAKQSLGELRKL